ncbi:hypothetical protein AGR2A_pb20056 [Agrobacterium genomosp. 2 str. CFBP 5494]|uniref:Uncharacterized protein n=1 Tax=Agrobacterium genomosp. 2 str. CFBP 5494 TaxID=1183436 RepID=A0A9W5B7W2_9HYPH|nr:hypothetical protein AGR2A_pb20056 [Agrobacterium genomosp. 2 str. CFBP 5494]
MGGVGVPPLKGGSVEGSRDQLIKHRRDTLIEQRSGDTMEGGGCCARGHLHRNEDTRPREGDFTARRIQPVVNVPVELRHLFAIREQPAPHESARVKGCLPERPRHHASRRFLRPKILEADVSAPRRHVVNIPTGPSCGRIANRLDDNLPWQAGLFRQLTDDNRFRAVAYLVDDARQDFRELRIQRLKALAVLGKVSVGPFDRQNTRHGRASGK